jgi:hypothetical protein
MGIRAAIFCVLGLAAAACGTGTWSNDDLQFLNALPAKGDLASQLPNDGVKRAGLTGSGIARRQDELVGDRSLTYQGALDASDNFNKGLDGILSIIETVRAVPPSLRDGPRRVWGPYPADQTPGFEVRVVMDKTSDNEFAYRIEFSKKGSGEWITFLQGDFLASSGIRKGVGSLTLLARQARANGLPTSPDLDKLDTLDVTYATDADPIYVSMNLKLMPPLESASYEARRYADKHGQIRFVLSGATLDKLTGPQTLQVSTIWLPTGEGRSESTVIAGTGKGLRYIECWDAAFVSTWISSTWTAATGAESQTCKDLGVQLAR